MEAIKEKRGGRRPGAGRKKTPSTQLKDAIDNLNVTEAFKRLETWAKGEPVICPWCNKNTGKRTADTVALQSNLEIINRKLGKVPQSVQVDITETINLNADQLETVLHRHLPQIVELYRQEIIPLLGNYEGKKLLPASKDL